MTDPNPLAPKKPAPAKVRPVTTIIDDQMPRRLIVQLDTYQITADDYEAAVRAWHVSESPPALAFLVSRAILAAIKSAR